MITAIEQVLGQQKKDAIDLVAGFSRTKRAVWLA
jgi:hypothetical protein